MKRIIVGISLICLMINSLMAMPSAKEMRKTTEKATKAAYGKLLKSKNGKEVYSGIMKIFEKNISKIAKGGFYNMFTITIYNSDKIGHGKLLKKLSKKDQAIMREKIVNDLKDKGYKITLNQYWNNPDKLNISISW
ncbi:MAG: hypothetical protein MJK08_05945 [Campylobacterales bacterium]|nr:hypothetical protein [Campylobacterales bacterium]